MHCIESKYFTNVKNQKIYETVSLGLMLEQDQREEWPDLKLFAHPSV